MTSSAIGKTVRITETDLASLGGIAGGMQKHVETLVDDLVKYHPDDQEPLKQLFKQLKLEQPDGSLTTALLPDDELRRHWTGSTDDGRVVDMSAL